VYDDVAVVVELKGQQKKRNKLEPRQLEGRGICDEQ
jgi:hypothetical protein